jgi:hypothetical protein
MSKFNPFATGPKKNNALETLKETLSIGLENYDRGADVWNPATQSWEWQPNMTQEVVISFSVNTGKGTGKQVIPASEFRDYVAVLKGIIESGYKEREGNDRTAYVPTPVIAAQSFKMVYPRVQGVEGKVEEDKSGERNVVSVRSTDGKGAKPMMIPRDQFENVVLTLASIGESIEYYEEQAWSNVRNG